MARAAETVAFTLQDRLAPEQLDEDTRIYVNGQEVARFILGADRPGDEVVARVPRAEHYEYAICGEARARDPDGAVRTHAVNDSGEIDDVAGRVFSAYTRAYVSFYLVDVTEDRPPARIRTHLGPRCPVAVSAR